MRAGDEAAARALWARHAPRLTAYAEAILAGHEGGGGADIVQESFLRLLRAPRREAREIADAGAWLLRVTRNLALNRVRSIRRERGKAGRLAADPRGGAPPANEETRLNVALASLPRPMREVVALKHAGGLTFDQMSVSLGVNRSTLAARYRRAIELLRESMAGEGAVGSAAGRVAAEELAHARD